MIAPEAFAESSKCSVSFAEPGIDVIIDYGVRRKHTAYVAKFVNHIQLDIARLYSRRCVVLTFGRLHSTSVFFTLTVIPKRRAAFENRLNSSCASFSVWSSAQSSADSSSRITRHWTSALASKRRRLNTWIHSNQCGTVWNPNAALLECYYIPASLQSRC